MRSSQSASAPIAPVPQAERIQILDILRGFALFGILFVNMPLFNRPFQTIMFPADASAPWFDRAAEWLIHFLGEGKFYAMFSLLFGLGLTLLMGRVEGRGGRFVPLYLRRLLVLLGFGLIHAWLIWVGDILTIYALLGVVLLLFRRAKPRTLLIWAAVLIALPLLFLTASAGMVALAQTEPAAADQLAASFAQVGAGYLADLERASRAYGQGTFLEITAQRLRDSQSIGVTSLFALGFNVLAMFLVGVYFGKREIFRNLEANRPLFRKLLLWGMLVGLPLNALYATLIMGLARYEPTWPLALATAAQGIGAPLLSLGYASGLVLLFGSPLWEARLKLLAPVGQMALTNYLLQSIICTLIFYNYGLGLFGKVGTALGILLTIVIYLLQIPFSHWWMRRFQYGPAEWLWRSLTYLRRQPLKRSAI